MQDELEKCLAKDFPFMRQRESFQEQAAKGRINDLYGAFGCECGDGWYSLLHDLCSEIMEVYEAANHPVDIIVDQVKEKFGSLRFYYHFENQKPAIQAIDFLGQGTMRLTQADSDVHQKVAELVRKAEAKSETVCERCGKTGSLRKGGWLVTLCDLCYQKQEKRERS